MSTSSGASSRSTGVPLTDAPPEPPVSAAATAANPAPPGPGFAPGNAARTSRQSDPGSIGGGTTARPERYLIVARYVEAHATHDGTAESAAEAPAHYLFVRWPDWPPPAMLALSPPVLDETLAHAVELVLSTRLGVHVIGAPRLGGTRIPARMPHSRIGVEGLGWLRPVAVSATGVVAPDALLAGFALLTAEQARTALSTDVERIVFNAGVALFD